MQSRVAIGSTRAAIGYAREVLCSGRDRVKSNGIGYESGNDRVRSNEYRLDLDLGSGKNRIDRVSIGSGRTLVGLIVSWSVNISANNSIPI